MVFISYSRSEAPFVDALAAALVEDGLDVWLDYRSMKPGQDWNTQLENAIERASVVVLVVSKRSIKASVNVDAELKLASRAGCRVVLAIVEAVPLPKGLNEYPWVDMRGDFTSAVKQLSVVLTGEAVAVSEQRAPQSGFRAPPAVWMTAALAVPVSLLSLAALWTVVIPFVLVPLPVQLLRREFNYAAVRTSLIALPWAVLVASLFAEDIGEESVAFAVTSFIMVGSIVFGLGLYLAMRATRVRRWMKPVAARPKVVRRTEIQRVPMRSTFAIDVAAEDVGYAAPIERALRSWGHEPTEAAAADVTLRLVTRFNDTREIPADRLVLPILVQDPDDELPERLRRTQWIDLRRGARPAELDGIARLLDDPAELLGTIGVPPPHQQLVMPPGVFGLYLGLWAAVLAPMSALWFAAIAQVRYDIDLDLQGPLGFVILAAPVAALSWVAKTALVERRPGVPLRGLVAVVSLGLFGLLLVTSTADSDDAAETFAAAAATTVLVPTVLMPLTWAVYGTTIERWIPVGRRGAGRELPDWRSQGLRLLAFAFAITIYLLGYFV